MSSKPPKPASPPPPADVQRDTDRRALLLQAGGEIFAQRPYDEVSAQDIAEHAGVAYGLLFHYFGTKQAFFLELIKQASGESLSLFEGNREPDPARWARRELKMFLATLAAQPRMFLTLMHGSIGIEPQVQEMISHQRKAEAERFLAKLAPERRSDLLEHSITAWIASVNEMGARWIESGARIPRSHLIETMIASLNATLQAVAAVDRKARFDPTRFAGTRVASSRV